jgi:hypothetical protein
MVVLGCATGCGLFPSFAGLTGGQADDAAQTQGWCASQSPSHLLCDDFDEPDAGVVGPWQGIQQSEAGAMSLSDAYSLSPPSSLWAQMGPTSIGAFARLVQTYATPLMTSMTFAFDLLTKQPGLPAGTLLATVFISLDNGEAYGISMGLMGDAPFIWEQQGASGIQYDLTTHAAIGAWQRISIQVTWANPPSLTVQLGLADAGSLSTALSTSLKGIVGARVSGGPSPLLGFSFLGRATTEPLDCYFDSVTFDYN